VRDQVRPPGQQAETRADRAVFVEARGTDVDVEFEHAELAKTGRPDASAASIVHIN
jgi:hypothetical protein